MNLLAIDVGATSGRASLGAFDGTRLRVQEIARFPNDPVRRGQAMEWDIPPLHRHTIQAIRQACSRGVDVQSAAIVTWGLDFGLIDDRGALIQPPRHYRDQRNQCGVALVDRAVTRHDLFAQTGIQHMRFNSIHHLAAMTEEPSVPLERASAFLQIADLLTWQLTGHLANEITNATTTQLIDIATRAWHEPLMTRLGIPPRLFRAPVEPPAPAGPLAANIAADAGVPRLPFVTVASHDTASAVVAIPAASPFAFISCGTWSLLGTETSAPVVTPDAEACNFSNEGGVHGTNRLLKNIMGLWLLEECRREWHAAGWPAGHDEIVAAGREAAPLSTCIDPDATSFEAPRSMAAALDTWIRHSGQRSPHTPGEIARVILQSLALKYRHVLAQLERVTGTRFPAVHIVGGGSLNPLLCQFTANATGRPVVAGPAEATTLGNVLVQLMHAGQIDSLAEARELVRQSVSLTTFLPEAPDAWSALRQQFDDVLARSSDITRSVESDDRRTD